MLFQVQRTNRKLQEMEKASQDASALTAVAASVPRPALEERRSEADSTAEELQQQRSLHSALKVPGALRFFLTTNLEIISRVLRVTALIG